MDLREQFNLQDTVKTAGAGTYLTLDERYRQQEAEQNASGITELLKANIADPNEASAVAGMTYTLADTFKQDPITILQDLPGWAARYNGTIKDNKGAWQQVWDGFKTGWATDRLGRIGSALMVDRTPEERQNLLDEVARIRASIPGTEGNSESFGMKMATSSAQLIGTMVRPLLTNLLVSAILPEAKIGAVMGDMAGKIPAIAAKSEQIAATATKVVGHGVSMGVTWADTAQVEAGNIYLDMLDAGVDEDIAKKYANIHGVIAGALEALPLEFAFTRFPFLKNISKNAFNRLCGRTVSKVGVAKTMSGALANAFVSMTASNLFETLTEVAQEGSAVYFEKKAALALPDEVKDEKLRKMLPEVYGQWRAYYEQEVADRKDYYESQEYKDYVADRIWDVAVQTLMGTAPLSFFGASGQVIADVNYTRNIKKDAGEVKSRSFFINKHLGDEQLSNLSQTERRERLAQIYEENHDVEGVSNAEAKNLDADYMEINELSEQPDETEEEAVSSPAPKTPIKRRKDGRLHTQESMNVEHRADGKDIYTLKLGSAENRNRYGRIEYSIDNDTVRIEDVFMKPGQQELTGEFVTELMRRYPGYNVEWDAKTESLQKVKDQLISENTINPDKLQRFLGKGDINERLKVREYIQGKVKEAGGELTTPQAEVYTQLLEKMAEGRNMTLSEFANNLQFKTFEEAGDLMTEEEKAGNKGAFQLLNAAGKGIIYVGEHGDISTLFHELTHFAVQTDLDGATKLGTALKNAAKTEQFRKYIDQHYRIMKNVTKKEGNVVKGLTTDEIIQAIETMDDNPMNWTATQHEVVAVLGETYAQEGRSFNKDIQSILDKFIDFFYKIYRLMKQNALLNDDIVKAYDNLFSPELKEKFEAQEQAETKTETKVNFQPTQQELAEADRQYKEIEAQYKGTSEWLKAPNGQPTNLTERQWVQVRTPAFKAWFGDWENDPQNASKVVDENGEPLVVYHGTGKHFTIFDIDKTSPTNDLGQGFYFTDKKSDAESHYMSEMGADTQDKIRREVYDRLSELGYSEEDLYSSDPEITEKYNQIYDQVEKEWAENATLMPVFLKIDKPYEVKERTPLSDNIKNNYDGIIDNTVSEKFTNLDSDTTHYIAFSPEQIKSATDNVGTFSQSNPSILFQSIGEQGAEALDKAEESTYRMDNLALARELEADNKNAKTIRFITGWERGKDKKWRYEIDDFKKVDPFGNIVWLSRHPNVARYLELNRKANAYVLGLSKENLTEAEQKEVDKLKNDAEVMAFSSSQSMANPDSLTLEDYIDAPELFKAYPQLRDVPVVAKKMQYTSKGAFVNAIDITDFDNDAIGRIEINKDLFDRAKQNNQEAIRKLRSTLIHEIQHAIQSIEEFARGGSVEGKFFEFFTEFRDKAREAVDKAYEILDIDNKIQELPEWKALGTVEYYDERYDELSAELEKSEEYKKLSKELKDKSEAFHKEYYYIDPFKLIESDRNRTLYDYIENTFNDKNVAFKMYQRLAGEVESRNAQARMNMTPEQRRETLLSETEDVAREDQIVLMDGLEAQMALEKDSHSNLLFQSAYHGSGASFDKFDTDFMGTGEGAQAFGWGIYLTQSEGIARSYAEKMGNKVDYLPEFYSKGVKEGEEIRKYLNNAGSFFIAARQADASMARELLKGIIDYENRDLEDRERELRKFENYSKQIEDNPKISIKEFVKSVSSEDKYRIGHYYLNYAKNTAKEEGRKSNIVDIQKQIDDYVTKLRQWRDEAQKNVDLLEKIDLNTFEAKMPVNTPRRNLYTASIPDDTGSNYLYWDKEYTRDEIQPIVDALVEKLKSENPHFKTEDIDYYKSLYEEGLLQTPKTGEQIYHFIEDRGVGGKKDKEASEFLNSIGYVGIDYPANSLSGGNKYGKRNFVIFNADDITIDNHLMWQGLNQDQVESDMLADAKDETLDDWLEFNRKMSFGEPIDEQYLTSIWEKANNITETADGEKVVDTSTLTEEEKDTAFASIMQTEDGVKGFLKAARDMYTYMRNLEREGVSDEEDRDYLNRLYAASSEFETKADNFMVTFVKGNKSIDDIDPKFLKSLQGKILKNKTEYRGLFAAITDNENMSVGEQELPFIDEPSREKMEHMTISEKRKFVDKLRDADAEKKILSGKETYEGAAENIIKRKNEEIAEQKKVIADKQKEIDREFDLLTSQQKKIVRQAEYQKEIQKKVNELSASIRAKLDKDVRIPTEEYQKLNSLEDRLKLIKEEVSQLNEQTKLKALVEKREALAKLKADIKEKEKERRAAQAIHDYKVKLVTYIQKKVGKNIWWEQAEAIKAIQAALDPTGYDNFFINYNGERMNLTAFRSMVERESKAETKANEGETFAALTPYQWKRYLNKDLSEYTIQDLEEMYDTVRYLKKVGREAWQQRVDQRNYEAQQWQNRIINEFMATGRYVSPSDVPLPETAEALKQEKNLWNMIRTGWYKTINMARKAQIMDGGTKAAIYKLLVSDKRDVQNAEYEAISKRIKPIEKLMKDLGVKPEDFYKKYTLKIGNTEQTYTLSQIIYGVKAQLEERNKLAVMGGNLIPQKEKEVYGHNNQTLEAIAESRYQQFIEQAQEILKGKEKEMKVAEAIWNDWQDKDNFGRLNEAAIEEYNMPVDPVQFYMPIARKDFNGTELAQKIADDIFNQNAGKNRTSVEQGMLKSRQTISLDKQMPVDMDFFKLWTDSVKDQEHFIATNAYVRKLNRVFKAFGSKDLRANIESAFGRGMLTDIDNYINEVANPDVANDTQGVNKFLSILRGALYPAYLAFKSSSVILQMITSPAPFLREVGPLELAKGLIQMSIHPVATWEYVTGLSSFMENRSMNPLVDEVEAAAKRYNDPRWLQIKHKLQEVGTSGLEMADRWAVTAGWLAVFDKKKAEYLAEGMDEKAAEKKAVKYADDVVYETQPLGDKTELAPLFKVGGPAWQAFTQFQVSLNVIWNNLTYDVAVNDIRNKEYRKLAGTIIGYALAGVILYSVQEGWGTDDDDTPDEKLKKMLKAIAYGSTTQFTSAVPLLSNNADAIVKKIITGEKWSYRTNQLYPGFDELAMGVATTNWKKVLSGAAKLGGVPVSGPKEFYHVIHGKEAGDWRFYPQALLGRREK